MSVSVAGLTVTATETSPSRESWLVATDASGQRWESKHHLMDIDGLAVADDVVLVRTHIQHGGGFGMSNTSRVIAYAAQTGAELWVAQSSQAKAEDPSYLVATGPGTVVVVISGSNINCQTLCVLDPATGRQRWQAAVPETLASVAIQESVVYARVENLVVAWDASSGAVR